MDTWLLFPRGPGVGHELAAALGKQLKKRKIQFSSIQCDVIQYDEIESNEKIKQKPEKCKPRELSWEGVQAFSPIKEVAQLALY